MNSASQVLPHSPGQGAASSLLSSGNWPVSTQTWPSLFERSPVGAHQSGGRGFASFPAVPACAALIGANRIAAKSRTPLTLPFVEVNNHTHDVLLSSLTVTGGHSQLQESWA